MSYFKKLGMFLPLAVLAGCVNVGGKNSEMSIPQASGSEAGKIVVFASDTLGAETLGITINEQFIAPLQANKQFTQSLCSGAYQIGARSVDAHSVGRKVKRVIGEQFVQVVPQHTTYLEVTRAGNGWALQEVSQEEWQMKASTLVAGESGQDSKIVRRITSSMVKCK